MAQYKVVATVGGDRIDSVRKKLVEIFGQPSFTLTKINPDPSRADRAAEAEAMVDEARGILEDLSGELEQWKDNLPENLQDGAKAEELDDAISSIEDATNNLDEAMENIQGIQFPQWGG